MVSNCYFNPTSIWTIYLKYILQKIPWTQYLSYLSFQYGIVINFIIQSNIFEFIGLPQSVHNHSYAHGLRTPGEEIAFTARPKIHSHSQNFRYGRRIFCLPHRPKISGFIDFCLHWVSVVCVQRYYALSDFTWYKVVVYVAYSPWTKSDIELIICQRSVILWDPNGQSH